MVKRLLPTMSLALISMVLSGCNTYSQPPKGEVTEAPFVALKWQSAALAHDNITTIEGNPTTTASALGDTITFDGEGDRLVVNQNPLWQAEEFTIEVIIKPNDAFPENTAPRYLHIESADNSNRRITMEMRLNENKQWYLDAYIKSDNDKYTLIDKTLVHPIDQWAHTAITYKNKIFTSFVNGEQELSATVQYLPIAKNAKTSIGARLNKVHWFSGSIFSVAVTHKALEPSAFKTLKVWLKSTQK